MTTPCSLVPISAPHIHQGREINVAWVCSTWGTSTHVHATRVPAGWSAALGPLEELGLVGVAVAVLGEHHPVAGDGHKRITHRVSPARGPAFDDAPPSLCLGSSAVC